MFQSLIKISLFLISISICMATMPDGFNVYHPFQNNYSNYNEKDVLKNNKRSIRGSNRDNVYQDNIYRNKSERNNISRDNLYRNNAYQDNQYRDNQYQNNQYRDNQYQNNQYRDTLYRNKSQVHGYNEHYYDTRRPERGPSSIHLGNTYRAPFREQQEDSHYESDEQTVSNVSLVINPSQNPQGVNSPNLTYDAIDLIQEADKLWEAYLNEKIKLESIENSLPSEKSLELSNFISSGLADISSMSTNLSGQILSQDEIYKDEDHIDELHDFGINLEQWKTKLTALKAILDHPSEDHQFEYQQLQPNSQSWYEASHRPSGESANDQLSILDTQPVQNVMSSIENVTVDETKKQDTEFEIKDTPEILISTAPPSSEEDQDLKKISLIRQVQDHDEFELDDLNAQDFDGTDSDEIALPPIIPGSGILSASGFNENEASEALLLEMERNGVTLLEDFPEDPIYADDDLLDDVLQKTAKSDEFSTTEMPPLKDAIFEIEKDDVENSINVPYNSSESLASPEKNNSTEAFDDMQPLFKESVPLRHNQDPYAAQDELNLNVDDSFLHTTFDPQSQDLDEFEAIDIINLNNENEDTLEEDLDDQQKDLLEPKLDDLTQDYETVEASNNTYLTNEVFDVPYLIAETPNEIYQTTKIPDEIDITVPKENFTSPEASDEISSSSVSDEETALNKSIVTDEISDKHKDNSVISSNEQKDSSASKIFGFSTWSCFVALALHLLL